MDRVCIETNDDFGRHIVLSGDVKAGEVVVDEFPFAIGPKQASNIVCVNCFEDLDFDKEITACRVCTWPLCEQCQEETAVYHKSECEVFKKANAKFSGMINNETGVCTQLDCITPLRVLLKKEEDPERWEKEVECMEYHDLARRTEIETWNADLNNVAKYLRGPCKLQRFSEDLIMQVIGILEVNAFEGRTASGYVFRGLYPMTGILAHNCVPNTSRSIYPSENYRIRLRAMVDLKEGQQLYHSYTYTLSGTRYRQEHLKSGKFFICKCERCVDPTELGTHFSSFKCTKCDPGWFHTTNPINAQAEWKCTHCAYKLSGETVQKATIAMQMEIDQAMAMENSPEKIEALEKISKKFKSLLHPLHYMNTGMRQSLIEMYGRVNGYGIADLPDILLEHKQEICEQVLRVLNKFEPGISRSRAFTLYEMHVPIVLLAKSAFIAGVLSPENLKDRLQNAIDVLNECVSILKYEDKASQEGGLCTLAEKAVEQLNISAESL